MVDVQPELFDSSDDPLSKVRKLIGNPFAYNRVRGPMTGPEAPAGENLQLDVHLYWLAPEEYGRTDVDGALHSLGYRVKNRDEEISRHVARQTRTGDWAVCASENPWGGEDDFHTHVGSPTDIDDATDRLVEHFAEFGDDFAAVMRSE